MKNKRERKAGIDSQGTETLVHVSQFWSKNFEFSFFFRRMWIMDAFDAYSWVMALNKRYVNWEQITARSLILKGWSLKPNHLSFWMNTIKVFGKTDVELVTKPFTHHITSFLSSRFRAVTYVPFTSRRQSIFFTALNSSFFLMNWILKVFIPHSTIS